MKRFDYYNPVKIHYECNYIDSLEKVFKQCHNVLLMTTKGVLKRLPEIERICSQYGVDIFSDISSNPELEFLQRAKEQKAKIGSIVAIGGGSVMDSAKFFAVQGEIQAIDEGLTISSDSQFASIFAIPTTAGTSSELTKWATVWDSANFVKYSLSHEKLYPQEAFYDSSLMLSLSRGETINGALDTLSHCLESIWNKNSNPISRHYALKGIELILETLPSLLENLQNLELRKKITLSNIYAGLAFSNTQTALAHALSYPMTMKLEIPHGIACSITLPVLLKNIVYGKEYGLLSVYKQQIVDLFDKIGVSTNLGDYGVTKDFIEEIFSNLNSRAKNGLFDIESVKSALLSEL